MIDLAIPGFKHLKLSQLVLDYNGTLAFDGKPLEGVNAALVDLSSELTIHVVSGDTYGTASEQLHGLPCRLALLKGEGQAAAKREFVRRLGADVTVAIGNGRNDVQMLRLAALAIGVVGPEGAALAALAAADVITRDIHGALGLLQNPRRLVATLRS